MGKEILVLRLVEVQFQPDKLSGVPAEIGMREHGPHQAAARSPRSPALDEDRLLALLCLRERLLIIVLDDRELCGKHWRKADNDQQSKNLFHATGDGRVRQVEGEQESREQVTWDREQRDGVIA